MTDEAEIVTTLWKSVYMKFHFTTVYLYKNKEVACTHQLSKGQFSGWKSRKMCMFIYTVRKLNQYPLQLTYWLDPSVYQLKEIHSWQCKLSLLTYHITATVLSPHIPMGVYYSPWGSNCLGQTIKVIAVFMRTDFQSGKCSRVTFLLSTIQPLTCWVIIAAHL